MAIPNPAPERVPSTVTARLTIWIWAGYAMWQGAWIIQGGSARWSSEPFDGLNKVPTSVWGASVLGFGVALLTASILRLFWVKAAACIGLAVWSICLASGAFAAARHDSYMPSTGGPTYVAIAAAVLVLVFIDERRDKDDRKLTPLSPPP